MWYEAQKSIPLPYWEMTEGARFENSAEPETIGLERSQSVRAQSLTEESDAEE